MPSARRAWPISWWLARHISVVPHRSVFLCLKEKERLSHASPFVPARYNLKIPIMFNHVIAHVHKEILLKNIRLMCCLQLCFIVFCYSTVEYSTAAHPAMCTLSYIETSQPTNLHWVTKTKSSHRMLINTFSTNLSNNQINIQFASLKVLYCLSKQDCRKEEN